MAGRDVGAPRTLLEALLRTRDRTYEEIASEFDATAVRLGERGVSISTRHLRRLASGQAPRTTPATSRVLRAMFGMPASSLLGPWQEALEPGAGPLERSPESTDVEILVMAAERTRQHAIRNRVVTSTEEIDLLSEEIRELALTYQRVPLGSVLGRLVRAQEAVLASVDERQKPSNMRQLYFLAAIVSGILAYAADDVARQAVAMTYARAGYMYSEYTEHAGLRMWLRGIQSYLYYWSNQPREALRIAQAGKILQPSAHGSAVPWLLANEARAVGALGDSQRARELIADARRAREEERPDDLDEFGGVCRFTEAKRLYYAARTLAATPEIGTESASVASQAIDAYRDESRADWDYSCQADSRICLALSYVRVGDLEAVEEALAPVLDLGHELRTHDIVRSLDLIHSRLLPFTGETRARDLQEAIEIFTGTSLPRLPV